MMRQALLLLVCTALLATHASAKGVNMGKRPHRLNLYQQSEWFYNHKPASPVNSVPQQFNWCDLGNGTSYCTASWNQHEPRYCGSCWVHGTLSMIQDRLKGAKIRAGDLAYDVMLGRQTLLNCAAFLGYGEGCNGGEPLDVFKYMAEEGLPDESCMHYQATDHLVFKKKGHTRCPKVGKCMNCMPTGEDVDDFKCWAVKQPITYKLTSYGKLDAGEAAMQQEILARGPIVCGIACPEEFVYKYHSAKRGGVYIDKTGDTELDHDVEVVGWGEEEDGLKYWLQLSGPLLPAGGRSPAGSAAAGLELRFDAQQVRNSWGSYWGSLGFFKLQRGANALQIESGDCWYANPEYSVESAVMNGELEGSMYGLEDAKGHPHDDDDDDDDDDGPTAVPQAEEGPAESAEAVADDVVDQVQQGLAAALESVVDAAVQAEAAAAAAAAAGEQQAAAVVQEGPALVHEIGQLVPGGGVVGWVSVAPERLGHACAGMRQAAGQLWSMVASSAAAGAVPDMVRQAAAPEQQQQQHARRSWASVLSKRMFGGPQVAVQ
ncbi:hypothetical protein COO60DRAFT_1699190 [Scenedesmus sp. NREL 46B-D3]|nr:hypothetical protein COO60DRAFT_1699190 [Scenedesmus sp. NREL 46B-D3]